MMGNGKATGSRRRAVTRIKQCLALLIAALLLAESSLVGWMGLDVSRVEAAVSGPVAVAFGPAKDMTNVSPAVQLQVTFDEAVVKGPSTTYVRLYKYADNSMVESYSATSSRVTIDATGRLVTIRPTNQLELDTEYYVLIDRGAFINQSNSAAFVGISSAFVWNFRTAAIVDNTQPRLLGTVPDFNQSSATLDVMGQIKLNFNKPIYADSGTMQLHSTSNGLSDVRQIAVTSTEVTGSGTSTLTISPALPLEPEATYTLTVPATVLRDANGNRYAGTSFSVRTAKAALNATDLSPQTKDGLVSVQPSLRMVFDQNIAATSGKYVEIRRMKDNTVARRVATNSPQVNISGRTATISLGSGSGSRLDANTAYYVLVEPGAFSLTGWQTSTVFRGISNPSVWTFNTDPGNETDPPVVKTYEPARGGSSSSLTGLLELTFNEPIFLSGGTIEIRDTASNSVFRSFPITSARVSGAGTYKLTIDANREIKAAEQVQGEMDIAYRPFANNTRYYVTIGSQSIQDAAGNYFRGLSGSSAWSFTIAQDQAAPQLSSLMPATGSTGLAVSRSFEAIFNKPVQVDPSKKIAFNSASGELAAVAEVDAANARKVVIIPQNGALAANTDYYITMELGAITDVAGNSFAGILNNQQWKFRTVENPTAAPVFSKAETNGKNVILTYNEELKSDVLPSTAAFYITINGAANPVTSVAISNNQVILTTQSTMSITQTVRLSYTSDGKIQNQSGVSASSITDYHLSTASDTTVPRLSSGSYWNNIVTLEFSKDVQVPSSSAYVQFSATSGSTSYAVTSISSSGNKIYLGLNQNVSQSYLQIAYTPGTHAIRDFSGNLLASIGSTTIYSKDTSGSGSNPVTPPINTDTKTIPTLQSITSSGSSIVLTYNKYLSTSWVPDTSQYSVIANTQAYSVNGVQISGHQVYLTLANSIPNGQRVDVSYLASLHPLADLYGNLAGSFRNVVASQLSGTGPVGTQNPMVASAIVKGQTLTVQFTQGLNTGAVPGAQLFTVTVNGATRPVSLVNITASELQLVLSSSVAVGDNVLVSYLGNSTYLQTASGVNVQAFTNQIVYNQTSQLDQTSGEYSTSVNGGLKLQLAHATAASNRSTPSGGKANFYTLHGDKVVAGFKQLLAQRTTSPRLVFEVPSGQSAAQVRVSLQTLEEARKSYYSGVLAVEHGKLSYELPLASLNFSELAKLSGGTIVAADLVIELEELTKNTTGLGVPALMSKLNASGSSALSNPIYTALWIQRGASSPVAVRTLPGDRYGESTITMSGKLATGQMSALQLDDQTAAISYIPTQFATSGTQTQITTKQLQHGLYVIASNTSSFSDVSSHWAASTILNMKRKFIIEGRTAQKFVPNSPITRGEFATYIAKGMGLPADRNSASVYSDVNRQTTMGAYIGAASKAGIVMGNTDGTFKPDAYITRQEMAIMIVRAAGKGGVSVQLKGTVDSKLNPYSDRGRVSSWARSSVASAIELGFISGKTASTIAPQDNATRAEGVVMILRLLQQAKLY